MIFHMAGHLSAYLHSIPFEIQSIKQCDTTEHMTGSSVDTAWLNLGLNEELPLVAVLNRATAKQLTKAGIRISFRSFVSSSSSTELQRQITCKLFSTFDIL